VSAEKFAGGGGAKETRKPRNSTNKPIFILSVAGWRAHWACTQDSPQGNAAPRAFNDVKGENLFGKIPIIFLENFSSFSCKKLCAQVLTWP